MGKITNCITSIPHDKLLHILAGMLAAMFVLRAVSFTGAPAMAARGMAFAAAVMAGLAREIYNKSQGGVFDMKDIAATAAGGLITALLSVY